MKDFNDFIKSLDEGVMSDALKECEKVITHSGHTFTAREMAMMNITASTTAIITREMLRRYHEWLQST